MHDAQGVVVDHVRDGQLDQAGQLFVYPGLVLVDSGPCLIHLGLKVALLSGQRSFFGAGGGPQALGKFGDLLLQLTECGLARLQAVD